MAMEKRNLLLDKVKIESKEESKTISGYINKFGDLSEDLGFFETVQKGAFKRSLESDKNILALFDHDTSKILGSTRSETLKLEEDETGLFFELTLNDRLSYTRDVLELIEMKALSGCSFGFHIKDDEWEARDGKYYRTITELELLEITLTGFPAYESSEFSLRSLNQFKEKQEQEQKRELEKRRLQMELEIMKLK